MAKKKKPHKKPVYFNYKTLRTMPLLKQLQYISGLILHSQCHTRKSWGWNFPRSCEGGRSFCAQTFAKEDPWLNEYIFESSVLSHKCKRRWWREFIQSKTTKHLLREKAFIRSRHRWQRRLLKLREKRNTNYEPKRNQAFHQLWQLFQRVKIISFWALKLKKKIHMKYMLG